MITMKRIFITLILFGLIINSYGQSTLKRDVLKATSEIYRADTPLNDLIIKYAPSATARSAANGLSIDGNNTIIGGTLDQESEINGGSNNLYIGKALSKVLNLYINAADDFVVNADDNIEFNANGISYIWDGAHWINQATSDTLTTNTEVRALILADKALQPNQFEYVFSTSTVDSRPGAGFFSMNNGTPQLVTQIYVDDVDVNSLDQSNFISLIDTGSYWFVYESASAYFNYKITGGFIDATGYTKLNVTYLNGQGIALGTSSAIKHTLDRSKSTVSGGGGVADSLLISFSDTITLRGDTLDATEEIVKALALRTNIIQNNGADINIVSTDAGVSILADTIDLLTNSIQVGNTIIDSTSGSFDTTKTTVIEGDNLYFYIGTTKKDGAFDRGGVDPTNTTNLNYDGDFRATRFFKGNRVLNSFTTTNSSIYNLSFTEPTLSLNFLTSKTNGAFYTGTSAPDDNTRLNYDGVFYATVLNADTVKATEGFSVGGGDVLTSTDTMDAKEWFENESFDQGTIDKIYGNIIRENLLVVDKTNGNFTTLEGALDSIVVAGADSLNRWVINIGAGFFNENNPLNIPQYTTIKSVGTINTTVITPQNSGDVLRLSDICVINGISVIGADNAFAFDTSGNSARISDIIINDCDTALSMTNGTLYMQDIFIASDGDKMSCGFYQEGGSLTAIGIGINAQDSIGTIFDINRAITTVTNLLTFSANVDTVIHANNSAQIVSNTSSIVYAKNGIISTDSSSIRYNGNSHFNIQENYIFSDNTSIAAGVANADQNDNALEVKGQEAHFGSPDNGFEVCIGGGDSYSDKILVYEYNGSAYTNVSDSAKLMDGYNVEFPNTSVNTAIYIASDYNDSLKHDGYKLAMTDSMTIGGGEVVLEYWNGAWVEFNAMVTDADAPFAYHAKEYLEQAQSTHTRYNIEMTNDDWIANDIMSHGSDKKWVRFRIATSITTSPKIDQIKLHPSRLEVNADGYPESFGNARNTQILQLNIGSGQPIEGNMQSQDIYVDENIGVGYLNNRFTATGDILGFPINFPDNIDTGCPINLVLSGRATNAASIQWTIRYIIVTPDGTLYTTEPSASGNAKSVLTTARATVIGNNELFAVSLDISEAIPSRQGGFGDQLWITINPTTLSGSFDLTNIGAEYWTWSEGGHY